MNSAILVKTFVVLLAMMNAGINIGIFSPTFPDMQLVTSSTTARMSTTLTWMGVASAVGAVLSGPLFDRFNGFLVLALSLLGQGIAIGFAPWCHELIAFQLMSAFACIFNFAIMSGTLSVNCLLWIERPLLIGPIVQTTELVHAIGTAIAPQIIAPFLRQRNNVTTDSPPLYTTSSGAVVQVVPFTNHSSNTESGILPVQMAYLIVALLDVAVCIVCAATYVFDKCTTRGVVDVIEQAPEVPADDDDVFHHITRQPSLNELDADGIPRRHDDVIKRETRRYSCADEARRNSFASQSSLVPCRRARSRSLAAVDALVPFDARWRSNTELFVDKQVDRSPEIIAFEEGPRPLSVNCPSVSLLVTVCLFFVASGGRDAMLTLLLYTYAVEYAGWPIRGATLLVTIYHVTRVVTHVIVVAVSRWITPLKLTVANIIVLLISSIFLAATVKLDGLAYLGIGVVMTALATSNLEPTTVTLAMTSFPVTGKLMGLFIGSIALGQCVVSPVAGVLMQDVGKATFPFLLLALSVANALILVVWIVIDRLRQNRRQQDVTSQDSDGVITERSALIGNR